MTIDFTKPVRTKSGLAVRIFCTDAPGTYPIFGLVDGFDGTTSWCIDGRFSRLGSDHELDLVNCYLEKAEAAPDKPKDKNPKLPKLDRDILARDIFLVLLRVLGSGTEPSIAIRMADRFIK